MNDNIKSGITLTFIGFGIIALMDACMKWLTASYPLNQIVFFRSLFAYIPLLYWIFIQKKIRLKNITKEIEAKSYLFMIIRGTVIFISFACFVFAFSRAPLPDVTAMTFSIPLFTTFMAIFILHERLTKPRMIALVFGIIGMLFIIRPSSEGFFNMGIFVALIGSFFFGVVRIITRKYGRHESMESITFWTVTVWTALSTVSLIFSWVTPSLTGWLLLITIGILGGIAELLLVKSMQIAPASIAGPIQYTQLIWAIAFGILIWQDYPDIYIIFGAFLVIISNLYMAQQETKVNAFQKV